VLVASSAHGDSIVRIIDLARARGVSVQSVERQRLDALVSHHQGVLAEAAPFRYAALDELLAAVRQSAEPALLLALDTLQDPQNLGSLLRTAVAVGAHGALLPERRAVAITPAVAKASAGATEHLPIARVGNLVRALENLKAAGTWVVGLDARAETSYLEVDLSGPVTIVVGGEDRGLRPLVRQTCDLLVRLPMSNLIESLNAAVAGSIVLYEAQRQRHAASKSEDPLGEGVSSGGSI